MVFALYSGGKEVLRARLPRPLVPVFKSLMDEGFRCKDAVPSTDSRSESCERHEVTCAALTTATPSHAERRMPQALEIWERYSYLSGRSSFR